MRESSRGRRTERVGASQHPLLVLVSNERERERKNKRMPVPLSASWQLPPQVPGKERYKLGRGGCLADKHRARENG